MKVKRVGCGQVCDDGAPLVTLTDKAFETLSIDELASIAADDKRVQQALALRLAGSPIQTDKQRAARVLARLRQQGGAVKPYIDTLLDLASRDRAAVMPRRVRHMAPEQLEQLRRFDPEGYAEIAAAQPFESEPSKAGHPVSTSAPGSLPASVRRTARVWPSCSSPRRR
jgi:hypothetical protein